MPEDSELAHKSLVGEGTVVEAGCVKRPGP